MPKNETWWPLAANLRVEDFLNNPAVQEADFKSNTFGVFIGPVQNPNPDFKPASWTGTKRPQVKDADLADLDNMLTLSKCNTNICMVVVTKDGKMCGHSATANTDFNRHHKTTHPGCFSPQGSSNRTVLEIEEAVAAIKRFVVERHWRNARFCKEPNAHPAINEIATACERLAEESAEFRNEFGTKFHRRFGAHYTVGRARRTKPRARVPINISSDRDSDSDPRDDALSKPARERYTECSGSAQALPTHTLASAPLPANEPLESPTVEICTSSSLSSVASSPTLCVSDDVINGKEIDQPPSNTALFAEASPRPGLGEGRSVGQKPPVPRAKANVLLSAENAAPAPSPAKRQSSPPASEVETPTKKARSTAAKKPRGSSRARGGAGASAVRRSKRKQPKSPEEAHDSDEVEGAA